MVCFSIDYKYIKNNVEWEHHELVDALNIKTARNKLARKHKVNVEDIDIIDYKLVGYY